MVQPQGGSKQGEANPLSYLFGKTWQYSAGNRHKVVSYWIMFIMANTISLTATPLIMRKIVDVIQKDGITPANIHFLFGLLGCWFAAPVVFWSLHGPARLIERANAFRARGNYRKFLLQGIMTLPMEWHVEHHSGDTIDKVEKGATGLYDFSTNSFEVLYAAVQLAVSYSMLVYFSRSAAYIVVVMTIITVWIIMQFDRRLVDNYRKLNRAENSISESVFDAISNIATVIILRVERLVFEAIGRKIDKPFELFKHNSRLNETKWCLMSLCCNVMSALVLGVYFWKNVGAGQGILLGNVYILIQYLMKISETFSKFASMYGDILQRRSRVANAEELVADFRAENFTNHVLPKGWQRLQIENLSFSYQNGEGKDLHLNNVSLSFKRGERIAFVGASGSGKSTLLKIMRDIHHPLSLKLTVDGVEVAGFEGISRAMALVLQDPELFATSVGENITLGADHDPAVVRRFTDMACFTSVVEDLPRGLESSIREKGVNLSGGQQQRLALARGLLACADKDIVLLDEPTSSLDAVNETIIYQNIFREFNGKTIIVSTHSLRILPQFDRIYFIDEGKVIASGNLDDLLLTCPEFQKLWQQYRQQHHEVSA